MAKKPTLAARAALLTKTILGGGSEAPRMVQMPKAVHEIHVSADEVIPPGSIITEQLAVEARLDQEAIDRLFETGAIVLTDVLASAVDADDAEGGEG